MRIGTIAIIVAAVTLVVTAGCSYFSKVDKPQLAFNVGKFSTIAYMAEKDKLSQSNQDAVTKAWELFRDNAGKVTADNIRSFPDMLKEQGTSKIPNAAMRDKVNALIDKYWANLNKSLNLDGAGGDELVAIINALKDGIQAGLDQAAKPTA